MKTLHERLRWARTAAGYSSAAAFARHLDILPQTYTHHENGTRETDPETVRRYAAALKVNLLWLLYGTGTAYDSVTPVAPQVRQVPIISWVQAGSFSVADLTGADDFVPVSHSRETLFALRVVGSSMNRVAPPGSIIIVDYEDTNLEDGKLYVVRVDGELTFKRYRSSPERLEPASTDDHPTLFPDGDSVQAIGRVVYVVTPT